MHTKTILAGLLTALAVSSYAADSDYVESECSVKPNGRLWLQLQTRSSARRSISFDSGMDGAIALKGTTLNDGKWISPYKSLKEAVFRSPSKGAAIGMLELVSSNGGTKALGWVSSDCWKQLQRVANGALATRTQNGT